MFAEQVAVLDIGLTFIPSGLFVVSFRKLLPHPSFMIRTPSRFGARILVHVCHACHACHARPSMWQESALQSPYWSMHIPTECRQFFSQLSTVAQSLQTQVSSPDYQRNLYLH